MLIGFLNFLYVLVCILIILLVLIQKGKSSLGLGGINAGGQILFGGSGGQDIFQKTTWVLGALLLGGCLGLAILKAKNYDSIKSKYSVQRAANQAPEAEEAAQ